MSVEARNKTFRTLLSKDTNQWIVGDIGPRGWELNRGCMSELEVAKEGMSR